MRKITAILAALGILAAAACGCGAPAEREAKTLRLCEVTHSVFYAPQYVALSQGFFEEEGLAIELSNGGGADKVMTAVLTGQADIGLAGPEACIYVHNQEKEDAPVIFAQLTKRDGSFLLGREADDSFDFSKLKGKSIIAGRPGGMPYMTLLYVLRQHGLEPGSDVEVISNIQFNLMGGAFESGTGDYVTLFEPTASTFAAQGKGHIVTNMGLESGEVPYTTFMMRKDTIENEPGFAAAFVRAIYRAQKWVWAAGDEEVAYAMQPYFPDTDIATLSAVAKSYRATDSWTKVPTMTEDAFTRLQDILDGAGELAARIELSELVDNSFGEAAISEIG